MHCAHLAVSVYSKGRTQRTHLAVRSCTRCSFVRTNERFPILRSPGPALMSVVTSPTGLSTLKKGLERNLIEPDGCADPC